MAATLTRITKDMDVVEYFQMDSGIAEQDGGEDGTYRDLVRKEAGLWFGRGAKKLGLNGAVGSAELDAVVSGRIPDVGTKPEEWAEVDRTGLGATKEPSLDLTLSPPKSVSIEALVFGSREAIDAHEAAVTATLEFVQNNFIEYWNYRKREKVYMSTGNMVAATFQHETSRSLDPHLHTHCIIANITHRESRGWTAFYPGGLTSNMRVVRGYYHNELARNLMDCGYGIRRVVHTISSAFEIEGYGPDILGAFSARMTAISESIKQKGMKRTKHSMNSASIITRAKIKQGVPRQDLRDSWRIRKEGLGYDQPHPDAECRENSKSVSPRGAATEAELHQSIQTALDFHGSHTPVVSGIEIQASVLGQLPGRVDHGRIEGILAGMVEEGRLIEAKKYRYRLSWITQEERDAEHRLADRVREGQDSLPPINPEHISSRGGRLMDMSDGQREALAMMLTGRDSVSGMYGHTGTSMASLIRKTIELADDWEFIGIAPTIGGAMLLEAETGVPTQSLQGFLAEHRQGDAVGSHVGAEAEDNPAGTVLVLDQAMYMNNRQMEELLELSERLGIERVLTIASNALLRGHDSRQPFMNMVESGMPAVKVMDTAKMEHQKHPVPVENVLDGALMRSMDSLADVGETKLRILVEVERDDLPKVAADLHLEVAQEQVAATRVVAQSNRLRCEIDQEIRASSAEKVDSWVRDGAASPEFHPDQDDPQDSGGLVELSLDLDALKHRDHGYSGTASSVRGPGRVIAVFESGEDELAEQQNLAAEIARDSEEAIVLTDDIEAFTRDFEKNTGIHLSETQVLETPEPDPWLGKAAVIEASLPPEITTALHHIPEAVANAPTRSDSMLPAPAISNGDGTDIVEADRNELETKAAQLWLELPDRARERTRILATPDQQFVIAGEIRNRLRDEGRISGPEVTVDHLVSVPIEGTGKERAAGIKRGDQLVFGTEIPSVGIAAGDAKTVLEHCEAGNSRGILVRDYEPDGGRQTGYLDTSHLAECRVIRTMPMPLASGDWIRWRGNHPDQGIEDGRTFRVEIVESSHLHLRIRDGERTVLHTDHPIFGHSDYAFNLTEWEFDKGRVENMIAVANTAQIPTSTLLAAGRELGKRVGNALLVTDDPARLDRLLVKAGGNTLEMPKTQNEAATSLRR